MELVHNTTTPDIETASDGYRSRFSGPVGAYFLEVQRRCIAACLTPVGSRSLKILEVGGGHGQITEFLLQAGHEVWVQGSDAACFGRLEALSAAYPGRLHFVTSSLWRIPFEDRTFDIVIALRLMAHVERWRELLAEMARLAKVSVIVDFPAQSALNRLTPLLFRFKRQIEGNTRPYFSYSTATLAAEFKALGLGQLHIEKQFSLPMGVHRGIASSSFSSTVEEAARSLGLTALLGSPVVLCGTRS
ncbi:MAG: class I SAM-dependent methyltransferase [Deltaproteobacteria bacterium]|nr:class I SAM-dependent methyltransferase [Deltaproteobacteria bacterium]